MVADFGEFETALALLLKLNHLQQVLEKAAT